MKNEKVRVRFAPSPTGELHLGGARTALFNWLFARKEKGVFILRIEDTDVVRSREELTFSLIQDLKWLELDWDEGPEKDGPYGPYLQSQRKSIYRKWLEKLKEKDLVYECWCTPEELEKVRKERLKKGLPPRYDGRCRTLPGRKKEEYKKEGRKPTLRFKVPEEGKIGVEDLLRGKVEFNLEEIGDFVLLKSDGTPTFLFANVIDDHLMKITHIIRGDDHLSNTPRQLLLYQAFNLSPPKFFHLPMILGPDGAKLSKRHGAISVSHYRKMGYLPWAMVNFLALLGWSTPESQEFFEKEELIEKFSLERVGKSPSIFDPKKLEWMNGEYIRKLKKEKLSSLVIPYLKEKGWVGEKIDPPLREKINRVVEIEQERMKTLSEITQLADFFFEKKFSYDPEAVKKRLKKNYVPSLLIKIREKVKTYPCLKKEVLEKDLRKMAEELSLSFSQVFHPLRVALTGRMVGPGLFELAEVLGREEVIRRIERTLKFLEEKV